MKEIEDIGKKVIREIFEDYEEELGESVMNILGRMREDLIKIGVIPDEEEE